MDTSLIILGVALILVLYIVFAYMSTADALANRIDLNQPQTAIPVEKLTKPENVKYSYETWMYVYGPKSITTDTYIFSRDGSNANKKNIGLMLKANSPTLVLEYENSAATSQKVTISDNIPFQTWVHVIVSVDNSFVDVYLNGKLIKSLKDTTIVSPSSNSPVAFGSSQTYLAKFTRTVNPTDPQTAWNSYLAGNGENPIKKFTGDYDLALTFKKGDKPQDAYTMSLMGGN
jgi:hypothetical protein